MPQSKISHTGHVLKPRSDSPAASSSRPSASHLQELHKCFWIAMQIAGSPSHLCCPLLNYVLSTSPLPSKLSLFFSPSLNTFPFFLPSQVSLNPLLLSFLSLSFISLFTFFQSPQLYALEIPLLEAEFGVHSTQLKTFLSFPCFIPFLFHFPTPQLFITKTQSQ